MSATKGRPPEHSEGSPRRRRGLSPLGCLQVVLLSAYLLAVGDATDATIGILRTPYVGMTHVTSTKERSLTFRVFANGFVLSIPTRGGRCLLTSATKGVILSAAKGHPDVRRGLTPPTRSLKTKRLRKYFLIPYFLFLIPLFSWYSNKFVYYNSPILFISWFYWSANERLLCKGDGVFTKVKTIGIFFLIDWL